MPLAWIFMGWWLAGLVTFVPGLIENARNDPPRSVRATADLALTVLLALVSCVAGPYACDLAPLLAGLGPGDDEED